MLITIKTEPTAMARARTTFKRGRVWTFTPTKTKNALKELKLLIGQYITDSFPQYTPVSLCVTFYRTKPVTTTDAMPVRKPDLDNFLKTILDALNTLAFYDDAQVTAYRLKRGGQIMA